MALIMVRIIRRIKVAKLDISYTQRRWPFLEAKVARRSQTSCFVRSKTDRLIWCCLGSWPSARIVAPAPVVWCFKAWDGNDARDRP